MQPSLSQFWPSLHSNVRIYLHIENSPNDATSLQSSTSQRLFASLPRTPPSSCLQCAELTIDNSYFMTPHDLVSFLQKFSPCDSLRLTNVAWSAQADFASDLFARDLLLISPFSHLNVEVHRSAYTAETAWLAFSTTLRGLSTQGSTVTSASAYDGHDEDEHGPALQVLPSAQRAIFDICKSVCKVPSLNYVRFLSTGTPRGKDTGAVAYYICTTTIKEYKPAVDGLLPKIRLVFFGAPAVIPVTNISDSIVIDSISFILARIRAQSTTEPSNVGHSSDELPNTIASPWPEIVGLCAAQPGFMRLQLEFGSHDHLVQSMEAQCAALGKLHGRVALFYYAKNEGLRAADSETLADKGDADDYGYIDAVDLW
ncbi:hypothetical protein BC629DRAFT_1501535 [Irpex lacteus]|nr:hypothetical protein BC629DRAFT_1501535 [Irpex lacteus]